MTPRYRIQFKSYGHSGRATVFVTLMVVIHWVSMLGLIAWLLSNGTPISPEERLPLLIFFAFGIYLLLMARDRWRVYKNPPFIEFAEKKVLLPRGRYGSKSEWVNYDKILSFRVSGRPPLRFCLIGAG